MHNRPPADIPSRPVALTIAGSDSGGGAGIQADLRAFSFFETFGTTAITAVTAQNPLEVTDVHPIPPETVSRQQKAVFDAFAVAAVKTGMLFSAEIIEAVVAGLGSVPPVPLVVDPVMVATSGAKLLREDAVAAMCERLLPLATVITPNIPETEIICGRPLRTPSSMMAAALELARRYDCTVVVKGGHDPAFPSVDTVACSSGCWKLSSPVAMAASAHGTGCSLSAAIAACLARGDEPLLAVRKAKAYVFGALCSCVKVGPELFAMSPPLTLPLDSIECQAQNPVA
jgi:hydroxymethylpyrimidine/phosphomethylpyrimidine kinase